MKRTIWVRADRSQDQQERKLFATTAIENDLLDIIVRDEDLEKFERMGKFRNIRSLGDEIQSGDLKGALITISSGFDEKKAFAMAGKANFVVVSVVDWKVIPIENLIALFKGSGTKLMVQISDLKDVRLMLEALKSGVDGLVLDMKEPADIIAAKKLVNDLQNDGLDLVKARVTSLRQLGMGDRVCIDTCSILEVGEGMVIGSSSSGLFLIHSESVDSEYVDTRPFRVNAGPVHSYVQIPGNRTKCSSDLKVGDEVPAVDIDGNTRSVVIGRLKIERRPLMLLEAEHDGRIYNIILQNAETIRLISKDKPVSIVNLKVNDEIVMYVQDGGRHFGMKIEETIVEK